MRPEPPPLEPGSDAARLLHDIWSGKPIVHGLSDRLGTEVEALLLEIIPPVVAHLALRRGFFVTVAVSDHHHHDLRHAIASATAPEYVGVFNDSASASHTHITLTTPEALAGPRRYTAVRPDLVVTSGHDLNGHARLLAALTTGRQLLVLGESPYDQYIPVGPVVVPAIPFDVVIAGG